MSAFCVVCLYNMCGITFLGLLHWPSVPSTNGNGSQLFVRHPAAETLGVLQFSFQFFDLIQCFVVPGMNKPEMVVHHAIVTYVAWQVFDGGVMHEPSLFFLGACEIQSVPLTIIDFFTHVPPSTFGADLASRRVAESIFEVAKYVFAVLFFYSRIWLWMKHTAAFILNATKALKMAHAKKEDDTDGRATAYDTATKEAAGEGGRVAAAAKSVAARQLAEKHSATVAVFLAGLTLITALQLWWGGKILHEGYKILA